MRRRRGLKKKLDAADAKSLARAINANTTPDWRFLDPHSVIKVTVVPAVPAQNRKPPPGTWRDFGETEDELRELRGYNEKTAIKPHWPPGTTVVSGLPQCPHGVWILDNGTGCWRCEGARK